MVEKPIDDVVRDESRSQPTERGASNATAAGVAELPPWGKRWHLPALGLNVAPDAFIGVVIEMLLITMIGICLFVVVPELEGVVGRSSLLYVSSMVLGVAGVSAAVCLVAAVIGDPGIMIPPSPSLVFGDVTGMPSATAFEHFDVDNPQEIEFCRVCRVFVFGFDHHCGVIGGCVGKKTMCFFIGFLFGTAIAAFIGFIVSTMFLWTQLHRPSSLSIGGLKEFATFSNVAAIAVTLASMQGGTYCAILTGFYVHLVATGKDTHARRHRRSLVMVPRGSWRNRLWDMAAQAAQFRSSYRCFADRRRSAGGTAVYCL